MIERIHRKLYMHATQVSGTKRIEPSVAADNTCLDIEFVYFIKKVFYTIIAPPRMKYYELYISSSQKGRDLLVIYLDPRTVSNAMV